jgi:GxxExxY protein
MRMLIQTPYNETTSEIIAAAIDVHRALGPGLLESAYIRCEFGARGMPFGCEVAIPLWYKGIELDQGYRVDLIVENTVVVEVKSVETVMPVHRAQVLTYLKLTSCPIGLLINFNEALLVDGVHRIMNPALRSAETAEPRLARRHEATEDGRN